MRIIHLMLAAAVALPPIAFAAAAEAGSNKERRVCRREPTTGTRLQPPRVCMTQREWDAVAEHAKEDLSRSQNRQTVIRYGTGGRETCPVGVPC
jgi:hypothetical protein